MPNSRYLAAPSWGRELQGTGEAESELANVCPDAPSFHSGEEERRAFGRLRLLSADFLSALKDDMGRERWHSLSVSRRQSNLGVTPGKPAQPLGIDDDCSRRTHREADMAVHRGTFCHLLSCLPFLRGENPLGATDDPDIASVERLEIDRAEGVGMD